MAATKLRDDDLRQFIASGHTQAQAARHFGVSQAAVHQRLRKMRQLTAQVVALEKAGEAAGHQLAASVRFERVQQVITDELAWAVREARRRGANRRALQDVILGLAGEVRQQLNLQLNITRALVDLRVVKEFQEGVIAAIREEAPDTARRIVDRLKQRRALRPGAELPGLNGDRDANLD